jgi:hypothetical protein
MTHPLVILERRDAIATLTLNDPDRLNPLSPALQRNERTRQGELVDGPTFAERLRAFIDQRKAAKT